MKFQTVLLGLPLLLMVASAASAGSSTCPGTVTVPVDCSRAGAASPCPYDVDQAHTSGIDLTIKNGVTKVFFCSSSGSQLKIAIDPDQANVDHRCAHDPFNKAYKGAGSAVSTITTSKAKSLSGGATQCSYKLYVYRATSATWVDPIIIVK